MRIFLLRAIGALCFAGMTGIVLGPSTQAAGPVTVELYDQLKAFKLGGMSARVENFTLERDRLQLLFTGNIYFAEPVAGRVYGAVFLGKGRLRSEPWISYEKENIRRFLKKDAVDEVFTRAVLRFTDDTLERFARQSAAGPAPAEAREIAARLEKRLVRETGFNLSGRLLLSILNREDPGFFFGEFDGGDRGRFSALLDPQSRVPGGVFGIDAGEQGLIFQYAALQYRNDIWTAFFAKKDLDRQAAAGADTFDLVSIPQYRMEVDLRDPGNWLRLDANLELVALADNVRVIPMMLNEGLALQFDEKRKKAIHVLGSTLQDGSPVGVIQEDWETGFSLVLPAALAKGQRAMVKVKLQGKDSLWSWGTTFHYPRSIVGWYPRHGYAVRSRYDILYRHRKGIKVVSVGRRVQEIPVRAGAKEWTTQWVVDEPSTLITFAVGNFERRSAEARIKERSIPLEYYSIPGAIAAIDESSILTEIGNNLRAFDVLLGPYTYPSLAAVFCPSSLGHGFRRFPMLLFLPVTGQTRVDSAPIIAHETAHQWWGNMVAWQSYRDQWLNEGLAEYSDMLYLHAGARATAVTSGDFQRFIRERVRLLKERRGTDTGIGKEKLYEVGPLILGHRLYSRVSSGAQTLMQNKGALVLRMLHYLLTDPVTGDDARFFDMTRDFVRRHRNGWASTESFIQVASEHFARSPVARKYDLKNLDWFLSQWIYGTAIPSYHLDYRLEGRPDGSCVLKGTLIQENAPPQWFMPLPIVFEFPEKGQGRAQIQAAGPETAVEVALPERPLSVKLDPERWILSEEVSETFR